MDDKKQVIQVTSIMFPTVEEVNQKIHDFSSGEWAFKQALYIHSGQVMLFFERFE